MKCNMKTIKELRTTLKFKPELVNGELSYYTNNVKLDFDVFLPSKSINLQRGFCWSLLQKQQLIWSILMKRMIPPLAILRTTDDVYQVIDGKQRLSAMIDFYQNEFSLEIDGKNYFFEELPYEYQLSIAGYFFTVYLVAEDYDIVFTDQDKIDWFKFINFAGTPQDVQHFERLENSNSVNIYSIDPEQELINLLFTGKTNE